MENAQFKLDGIRVQTARMMEIYALLQTELARTSQLGLSPRDRAQLDRAIATIEANMRQLQAYIATIQEEISPTSEEARELEEILDSVLRWHMANEKGE